jgi:hypothetical protein
MINKIILLSVTILLVIQNGNLEAQSDQTFTPNGKPFALIFSDVNYRLNADGNSKAFEITRSYFGYEYNFTRNISAKVNLDVADPGIGKLQMTAYLKNALVQYKTNNFSVRFGLIGTDEFSLQEKQWGYRYIYKSFQDAYNFGPSADLGAAVEYSPVKFISFDVSVLNGEGYKKIQSDSTLKTSFGLTLKPINGFVLRAYYDMMNHNYNQSTIALFAAYTYKNLKAAIEYNNQKNNGMLNGHNFSGVSLYSSVAVGKKFSIFARYDKLWSSTLESQTDPWNYSKDGQLLMTGFDYSPTPGVKIAPNFQGWSPSDKSIPFTSTIALNFELKF